MPETAIEPLNDVEGERLMQLGSEVDQGLQDADSPSSAQEPEPRATGEGEATVPSDETVGGETLSDSSETGPETEETEQTEEIEPETPEIGEKAQKTDAKQPETEYSRAKKDQERLGRSWQALQAEKEEVRAREAALAEIEQNRQLQSQAGPMPVVTKDGFNRAQYEDAARKFNATGDYENEAKALRVAHEIERFEGQELQKRQVAAMQYQFSNEMNQMMQNDEALRSPDSPLAQTVMALLDQHPYLESFPNGFQRTVDIARLILDARSASELREAYEQAQAKLEGYERKSQPLKGGPTTPSSSPKNWESMSEAEKDREMEAMTREADRLGM
jgi:hypothetical protein